MDVRPRPDADNRETGSTDHSSSGSFWLADLSIRQPVFITMLVLAVIVVGFISYRRMGLDLFPDVSLPVVVVETAYPGASPRDVEQTVTRPIEDAVNSLDGVDTVHSTSTQGMSLVTVEFAMSEDPQAAADAVRSRLNLIRNALPTEATEPVVETFDPSAAPILSIAIADSSGKLSPEQLRALVDDAIKPTLEHVPGVGAVNVTGGQTDEIHVDLRPDRLKDYNLSPDRVVQAIRAHNLDVPVGRIPNGQRDAQLTTPGDVHSAADLADVPVTTLANGSTVKVRDVANVTAGVATTRSESRLDGQDSVVAAIQKQSGTNTVQVADAVKQALTDVRSQYPNLTFAAAFDQSTYTRESVDDLQRSLALGALLAALVVLLFFRDLRNTLVTVAGLPVILLGTVAVLRAVGITLNVISMMAISLSVGMLIDDAIVVRENIFRHVERGEDPRTAASRGVGEIALAVIAVTSTIVAVFLPIGFTEGIAGKFLRDFGLTVAVAVSISLVEAFTLAPMLSAHFFPRSSGENRRVGNHGQAATVEQDGVPVTSADNSGGDETERGGMSGRSEGPGQEPGRGRAQGPGPTEGTGQTEERGQARDPGPAQVPTVGLPWPHPTISQRSTPLAHEPEDSMPVGPSENRENVPTDAHDHAHIHPHAHASPSGPMAGLTNGYRSALDWSLRHRLVVVVAAVLSLVFSGFLFSRLSFSFVPASDQGTFSVSIDPGPGVPLADADRAARAVESVLRGDPSVAHVFTTVGSNDGSSNQASIVVTLRQRGQTATVLQRLRPRIQRAIPGVSFSVDAQSSTASFGSSAAAGAVRGRPIQFSVQGDDATAVDRVSAELATRLRTIGGAVDVGRSLKTGSPGLSVVLDPTKAAQDGITPAQVGATLRAMVSGEKAGTYHLNGQDLDVVVRLANADQLTANDLLQLPITTARGTTIQLSDVGHLVQTVEPTQIDRENRQRQVVVGADALGRNLGAVRADAQAAADRIALPPGVTIQASGQSQYTNEMFSSLGLAMGLAVLFVYMILASQFGSFVQPFIIMLALPFSFSGALLAIYLSHFDFDMLGMIGIILLMGLVSKNSILLVDLANRLRRRGASARQAMLEAGPIRLRPILMTTVAMIGGMIPVAVGVGAGSEIRRPMGVSVIGGLITSTGLTLIVVPVAFTLLADLGQFLTRRVHASSRGASDDAVAGADSAEGAFTSFARGLAVWIVAFGLLGIIGVGATATLRHGGAATPTAVQPTASVPTPVDFGAIPASASPPPSAPSQQAAPPSGGVPSQLATPRPPPSATAAPSSAVLVGDTGGAGLNLRGAPGTGQPTLATLSDGSQLQQIGDPTPADGHVWVKVRDAAGRVGWVAREYLVGNTG